MAVRPASESSTGGCRGRGSNPGPTGAGARSTGGPCNRFRLKWAIINLAYQGRTQIILGRALHYEVNFTFGGLLGPKALFEKIFAIVIWEIFGWLKPYKFSPGVRKQDALVVKKLK